VTNKVVLKVETNFFFKSKLSKCIPHHIIQHRRASTGTATVTERARAGSWTRPRRPRRASGLGRTGTRTLTEQVLRPQPDTGRLCQPRVIGRSQLTPIKPSRLRLQV